MADNRRSNIENNDNKNFNQVLNEKKDEIKETIKEKLVNSSNLVLIDQNENSPTKSTNSNFISDQQINFFNIPSSPPKYVAMEEIMKAANGVTNMYLSHQIALNENFKITKQEPDENSLRGQVEKTMRSAFWKILESQLNESPPNFKQALSLLQEIKENIFTFLIPQDSKLKQEIDEIFDLELIKQQAENGVLDFQRYAQYILSVLARLCAPIRDEKIKELTQCKDVINLFKGIMDLIELMKLDMANYTIQKMRPQIIQHSVEYEKQKFKEFFELQKKMNIDGLENTKKWLKRNFDLLKSDLNEESFSSIKNRTLTNAYIELLTLDRNIQEFLPETVNLDEKKIKEIQIKIHINLIIGSVLLVVFNFVVNLQNIPKIKEKLKSIINILFTSDMNLTEKIRLENIALQLIKEIQANLSKNDFPQLNDEKIKILSSQIIDLSNQNNRIRNIVQRRILEFIELALNPSLSTPLRIPIGLSVFQDELLAIAGEYVRFVVFNKSVFGDYYSNIIDSFEKQ